MPKLNVSEKDIAEFSNNNTLENETPLIGVYGAIDNLKKAVKESFKAGNLAVAAVSAPLNAARIGATGNKWCILFANNSRIVIAGLGYFDASIKDINVISKSDIEQIRVKNGILLRSFFITLKSGECIKFMAQKYAVFRQSNHKKRLAELSACLQDLHD